VSEPGANMDMNDARPASFWRSAGFVALLVAALAGGFLLYAEHRAHLFGDTGKPRNE